MTPFSNETFNFYKDFRIKCRKLFNKVLYIVHNSHNLYYSFLKALNTSDCEAKWSVLDFETYTIKHSDGTQTLIPYALGIILNPKVAFPIRNIRNKVLDSHNVVTNGLLPRTYYKPYNEDWVSWLSLLFKNYLLVPKNHSTIFWAHNGGRFDFLFILKCLTYLGYKDSDITIAKKDSIYLCIRVYFYPLKKHGGNTKYWIEFRDSYQLLPHSLRDLCESFNIYDKYHIEKGYLDHKSINEFNYLELDIHESINEYLKGDIISLFYILESFQNKLKTLFKIDALRCLTLPQLSLKIFRNIFYNPLEDKNKITLLRGVLHNFIAESYFGGYTMVYKPFVKFGYFYDFNSMYSFVMKKWMPTGHPKQYDIIRGLNNLFGFAKVKIIAPDIYYPLLPIRTKNGLIYGSGSWIGVYFSEELKVAVELGYQIVLIEAIEFEKSKPFDRFVDCFYDLKTNSIDKIERLIAKLMANALYGKTAQKPITRLTKIMSDNQEILNIHIKYTNVKTSLIMGDKYLVEYDINPNDDLIKDPLLYIHLWNEAMDCIESNDSCVQIASAVTSYARILLHELKINTNDVIYCDTDSIVTTKPISINYLGDQIGLLKNEVAVLQKDTCYNISNDSSYYFEEGIFLTPKVYIIKYKDLNQKVDYKISFKGIKWDLNEKIYLWEEFKKRLNYSHKDIPLQRTQTLLLRTSNFDIIEKKIKINISFEFSKRIKVYDITGRWYDTRTKHFDIKDIKYVHDIDNNIYHDIWRNLQYNEKKIPDILLPYPNKPFMENFNTIFIKDLSTSNLDNIKYILNQNNLLDKPTYYHVKIGLFRESLGIPTCFVKTLVSMRYGDSKQVEKNIMDKINNLLDDPHKENYWNYILSDCFEIHILVLKD